MRRPRYTLTSRDLGTDWEDTQGRTFTITGWEHGKVTMRFKDGHTERLWRTAVEARIDCGTYQAADYTAGRTHA